MVGSTLILAQEHSENLRNTVFHLHRKDWMPVTMGVQVQVQIEGGPQPVQAQPQSDQAAQVILAEQAREVDSVVIRGFCILLFFVI